jgi:hypothetical protein
VIQQSRALNVRPGRREIEAHGLSRLIFLGAKGSYSLMKRLYRATKVGQLKSGKLKSGKLSQLANRRPLLLLLLVARYPQTWLG